MRIAFWMLAATICSCTTHKNNIEKQQQAINDKIAVLYKQYTLLHDEEIHITGPLTIPADTIHFMDSLNTITDTTIGAKEIAIWEKIKALQSEYYKVGER